MHQQYNNGAMRHSENGIYFQVHLACMKNQIRQFYCSFHAISV